MFIHPNQTNAGKPDCANQTVHKERVLRGRRVFTRIPHFTVASFHKPSLKIDRMADERIESKLVGGERKGLEGCVEVGYSILNEEMDEVQPADRELPLGWREDSTGTKCVS